jgi:hypothetical protein
MSSPAEDLEDLDALRAFVRKRKGPEVDGLEAAALVMLAAEITLENLGMPAGMGTMSRMAEAAILAMTDAAAGPEMAEWAKNEFLTNEN